jgi:hypothetical protein
MNGYVPEGLDVGKTKKQNRRRAAKDDGASGGEAMDVDD